MTVLEQYDKVFTEVLRQVLSKPVRTEADCTDCAHSWKHAGLMVPHGGYCYMFKTFKPNCTQHKPVD